jgi:hypothetical protein
MMSKFGWSYPAGAANDPFAPYNQEESPCLVCGLDVDNCQCPECPECREHGNPKCVINQGKEWGHAAALKLMDEFGCDSLGEFYRRVYKSTGCGPTVGFLLSWTEYNDNGESGPEATYDEEKIEWVYCEDLYESTLDALKHGVEVIGVSVSSIVEGIDPCTDTVTLEGSEFTIPAFWQAVEDTDEQANEMWMETHGCEQCAKLWQAEGRTVSGGYEFTLFEGNDGITPVHDECKSCSGLGAVI